jgi:hypothetical protein
MDDDQLVRDIQRLAEAAVDSSQTTWQAGQQHRHRYVLVASLAALVVIVGGVVAVRLVGATAVSTQPGSAGVAATAPPPPATSAPTTSPGTTPEPDTAVSYPTDLPGTEIFRHRSVDGHDLLIGRLVRVPQDCVPPYPTIEQFCHMGQPETVLMVDSLIDGDYVGTTGNGLPATPDPSVPLTGGKSGGGGRPGHERVMAEYATSQQTTLVKVDIRQPDGTVLTDSMVPADGVVVFSVDAHGDFVGPARAYGAAGNLLGTSR